VATALKQEEVAVEVLVVDDASTDGTAKALVAIDDPRLEVLKRQTQGRLAGARNTGLRYARGEWVAFLDDDDLWSPRKLRVQLDAARATGAGFAYAAALNVDDRRRPLRVVAVPEPDSLLRALLADNVIPAGASNIVARTDVVRRVGSFDERFNHFADWDLWIRLAAASIAAAVPDILVAYRHHAGQAGEIELEVLAELDLMEEKHRELRARHDAALDREALVSWAAERSRKAAARNAGHLYVVARGTAVWTKRALRRVGAIERLPRPDWLRTVR